MEKHETEKETAEALAKQVREAVSKLHEMGYEAHFVDVTTMGGGGSGSPDWSPPPARKILRFVRRQEI